MNWDTEKIVIIKVSTMQSDTCSSPSLIVTNSTLLKFISYYTYLYKARVKASTKHFIAIIILLKQKLQSLGSKELKAVTIYINNLIRNFIKRLCNQYHFYTLAAHSSSC